MFNVGAPGSGFGRVADLFFTRRIGLSASGQPTPIIGGARLTGKVDRHNVAAMNITTGSFGTAGDNFFVGRYSRDILARSKVGGIVIDKQAVGSVFAPDTGGVSHYNRTFAADTTLAVHRNLTMTGFVAKTQTPGLTTGDMASYARATWLSPAFHVYTEFADLQENFNPEVGFIPRIGIRTSKFHGEWNPRPDRWNIRMFDPMWNITYTTDQHNRLLTRRIHNMLGTYFRERLVGHLLLQRPLRAARHPLRHPQHRRQRPGRHLPVRRMGLLVPLRSVAAPVHADAVFAADLLRRHPHRHPGDGRISGPRAASRPRPS